MHSSASYILPNTRNNFFVLFCAFLIKKNVEKTLLIPDHYHHYVISLDTESEQEEKNMKNENDDKV